MKIQKNYWKKVGQFITAGAIVIASQSCATYLKPSVPGMKNNLTNMRGVEYSTILSHVKMQIAMAQKDINSLRADHPKSSISNLQFKEGTGVLTAIVETAKSDTGDTSAVIPFSGLKGTKVTPSWSGDQSATDTRTEVFTFSIKPKKSKQISSSRLKELRKFNSNAIRDALVQKYKDILKTSKAGVEFVPQSLSITTRFVVTRGNSGKLSFEIIPTGHITKTSPIASTGHSKATVNQVSITLPFVTPTRPPGENRSIYYWVTGKKGSAIIQEPLTDKRYDEVVGGKPKPQATRKKTKIDTAFLLTPKGHIRPDLQNNPEALKKLLEDFAKQQQPEAQERQKSSPTPSRDPAPF